jgi:hypothetical protein
MDDVALRLSLGGTASVTIEENTWRIERRAYVRRRRSAGADEAGTTPT